MSRLEFVQARDFRMASRYFYALPFSNYVYTKVSPVADVPTLMIALSFLWQQKSRLSVNLPPVPEEKEIFEFKYVSDLELEATCSSSSHLVLHADGDGRGICRLT